MGHKAMILIGEAILSARFPPLVHLRLRDILQDNTASTILRCVSINPQLDHPKTVILKCPKLNKDASFHEWAGLEFIQTVQALHGLAPQVYGYDEPTKILVMEDLGSSNGQLLRHILMTPGMTRAGDALIAFQQALGRLHATTIGQHAAYACLRARYPNTAQSKHMIHHLAKDFDAFLKLSQTFGSRRAGLSQEIDAVRIAITDPGPFFSLTHGDTTPSNVFYTPSGTIRLYDFEACGFRHALLDGTYSHMRYLWSSRALDLPEEVRQGMYNAYRAALITGCPAAEDDTVFQDAYLAGCMAWLAGGCRKIPQVYSADLRWRTPTMRQRIMTSLRRFIDCAQAWGRSGAIMETCQDIERHLQAKWRDTDNRLPLYPAFTSPSTLRSLTAAIGRMWRRSK